MCRRQQTRKESKHSTTFEWDHENIKYGNTIRYCNDTTCEAIGGCGCPDTDIFQFVDIWNEKTLTYDSYCMLLDEIEKLKSSER